ncbi:MAG: hypothetical protein WC838_01205 [Candidatus Margulisiibacteriota bacterium]|jgi:hypothetical protein
MKYGINMPIKLKEGKRMDRFILKVADSKKAKALMLFLKQLNFIDIEHKAVKIQDTSAEKADLFKLAGLWGKRKISLAKIREKAWPQRAAL